MKKPTNPAQRKNNPAAAPPPQTPSPEAHAPVETLQQERNLFRTILDNLPSIIFCKDQEGRYVLSNRAHQRVLGATETGILGKTAFDFHPPDLARLYQEAERQIVRIGEPAPPKEEPALHRERGEQRWHLTSRIPLKDESGCVVGVVGISHDVTERKQAEEALQMFQYSIDQASHAVFWMNREGGFSYVNDQACRSLGYTREELLRLHLWDIDPVFPKDLWFSRWEGYQKERRGGEEHLESLHRRKDGTDFPVEVTSKHIWFGNRELHVAYARDITGRKQVEAALREKEEWFRTVFENASDGMFFLSLNGEIVSVNESFAALHGYSVAEILKMNLKGLDTPESNRLFPERMRRILAGENLTFEVEHYHKNGQLLPLEVTANLVTVGGKQYVLASHRNITGRKQAETALRQSQALYHSLVEHLPAGVFRKDIEGRYVFVNAWFCWLKGVKAELFLGKKPQEVATIELAERGADPSQINQLAAQGTDHHQLIMRTGRRIEAEEHGIGPNGKEQHLHVVKSPIFDSDGNVVGTQGIMFDITERKQTESALAESRRMLRSVLDTIPVRVFWKDTEGRYLGCNQPFARDAGFDSPEQLTGKNDFEMAWKDQADRYRADDRQVIASGVPKFQYEEPQTTPAGTQLWLRTSKIPLRDLAGRIVGVLGTYEDITGHKRAEERIREQAALLDAANDAIYVRALDHTVIYWNDGAERLYERTRAEALGRKITELGDVDHEAFEAAHAVLLEQGSWSGELKMLNKAGKEITIFCRWTLLRDEQNRPKEVLAINTDITEQKQLEANFLRAQRMEGIGALAGGIAHDLNNILQPILMTAPLLRETTSDPENREMLDTVESCARRGADIIRQLLTFARGTPGVRVPLPMRHLLHDMDKIIRETFPRNIQLHINAPKELWPVMGDATQIHQALMNLCVNARDAMPDGGALTLAAENLTLDEAFAAMMPGAKPGLHVCVSVADTGAGIPYENLDRIFDPFFTTKEIGKGTGLGLATVLGIVRGHGGVVRVDSRVGKGTTFELYLPASCEARPAARSEREALPPRGGGELILVVDDEVSVRGVVRRTLEKHGYQVAAAAEGNEAMALFARHQAEVRAVLTDMMMPGMDGPALVRALRQRDPHLPILGMTGVGEKADIKGLETLDLLVLLTKPFNSAALLGKLHQALATPRKT